MIPTGALQSVYTRVLTNFVSLAEGALGLTAPFTVEIGATGLRDTWLGTGHKGMIGPIHDDQVVVRRVLNAASLAVQAKAIGDFLDELFDLTGEERAA